MDFILVAIVAFGASLLTFFSGFGLGTILTPAFLVFFPIEVAVPLTAIVHFLNNIFKLGLVGKNIHWNTLIRFGTPALFGALIGAKLLFYLSDLNLEFTLMGYPTSFINITIALVILAFTIPDLLPNKKDRTINKSLLIPGGFLSGFFGGLSGHQGALRSLFLIHYKLSKEAFVATGVAIACIVDITRLGIYLPQLGESHITDNSTILITAIISAFAGAYGGKKLLKKVTLNFMQKLVAVLIIIMALLLAIGKV